MLYLQRILNHLKNMKARIILFVKTYLLFLLLLVLQKPLFMAYHQVLYTEVTWMDWLRVMAHGLVIDRSVAAYYSVIPGLLLVLSAWTSARWLHRFWRGYHLLISLLTALIFTADLVLYSYWGFRLDATPLFYFFSSPKDAIASVSWWMVLAGIVATLGLTWVSYLVQRRLLCSERQLSGLKTPFHRLRVSGVMLMITILLFIPIRGGFTVSTMNTGKAYFSTNNRLNHAAINPTFSLLESLSKQKDFSSQYRFMEADEANRIFQGMIEHAARSSEEKEVHPRCDEGLHLCKEGRSLFSEKRPDIYLLILESFSSHLMATLGGEADVTPHLDSLACKGILFTNFYANSFRTDRGLVSILSGYPAQPTTSLMKYPRKTQSIPSIANKLHQTGYATHYYYGGDADFTNMRSFLTSGGFQTIVSDQDFPVSERLSKWGVHDHLVFERLLQEMEAEANDEANNDETTATRQPQFRVLQTSSSHEPFEVPYERLSNPRLNAFAYTDSCLGDFVERFRRMPQWKRSLLIIVPDHLGGYPTSIDNFTIERYQIPLIMAGGVIEKPRRIDVYGSQQDLAATLLAQLGLSHNEFLFSKDLMNPCSPHFAFFAMPDGFGMVTPENQLIYDCSSQRTVLDKGSNPGQNLPQGKAYLQKLYDDIASR